MKLQHPLRRYVGCYVFSPINSFVAWWVTWSACDYFNLGLPVWPQWSVQILCIMPIALVLYDLCFYGLHRAMHTRILFRWVHSMHHEIRDPCPIDGLVAHPLETILVTWPLMLITKLLGCHVYILCAMLVIVVASVFKNHEHGADPDHFVHHRNLSKNFGPNIHLWDKLAGTFVSAAAPPSERGRVEMGPRHRAMLQDFGLLIILILFILVSWCFSPYD